MSMQPTQSTPPARAPRPDADDLRRDLEATLTARRELGTGYDQQFIESLVEKLTAHVRQEVAAATPRKTALEPDQRLGLAIASIALLIPLIAIAGGMFGIAGFLVVCGLVLAINAAAGLLH